MKNTLLAIILALPFVVNGQTPNTNDVALDWNPGKVQLSTNQFSAMKYEYWVYTNSLGTNSVSAPVRNTWIKSEIEAQGLRAQKRHLSEAIERQKAFEKAVPDWADIEEVWVSLPSVVRRNLRNMAVTNAVAQ